MDQHNPAAFPIVAGPDVVWDGMSLRDYFAARAMEAQFSNATEGNPYANNRAALGLARLSYEIADAMLDARRETRP